MSERIDSLFTMAVEKMFLKLGNIFIHNVVHFSTVIIRRKPRFDFSSMPLDGWDFMHLVRTFWTSRKILLYHRLLPLVLKKVNVSRDEQLQ